MTPRFSIVVPTRDRPQSLARCLVSLAALDYPREKFEVIVVDDGSASSPAEIVEQFSGALCVSLVCLSHSGPAAARNAGVRRSTGDFLAFVDDDCTVDRHWLTALEQRLAHDPGAVIGGRVVNGLPSNPYARASQGLQHFLYDWYHTNRRGALRFFTTNNLAVARADFDAIGEFDSSFPFASEDRDWCDRCLLDGRELIYAPEAVVHHSHDLTFPAFVRQHYRYGQGAVRFHIARSRRRGNPVRLEPWRFYHGMLTAPFTMRNPQLLRESLLLLTSQAVSLAGFLQAMRATVRSELKSNGSSPDLNLR